MTMIDAILVFAGTCGFAAGVGAAFTLGCAVVCRWLNWSPINITVVNNARD